MRHPDTTAEFERWIWIELIGFDNAQDDFAVEEFMNTAGFAPDAASLLLFNPDFIHTHDGMSANRVFPPDICSYYGHPFSEQRQRQAWTQRQLQGLIRVLRGHGVKVFLSVFDVFVSDAWIGNHRELFHVRRNGEPLLSICPWKRLADGSYYEDFFIRQLIGTVKDYGFDGFHCADGYAHQRIPISEGDFSDDMVQQFTASSGIALPPDLQGKCDGCPHRIEARADWVWKNRRREWIGFYVSRISLFMSKLARALHAEKKRMVMNTAWTKDPFEAIYRYGVDYRAMADAGVDAFIAETAAGAAELDGFEQTSGQRPLYPFMAALLLVRACTRDVPLICLNGIKDATEQWSVLRHAPAALESEIYALSNLYQRGSGGTLTRCAAGLMACLADSIRPEEWRWLRQWWSRAWEFKPRRLMGVTLVWSDAAAERQLDDFIGTRRWTTHRLLHQLLARGAPVPAVVRIEQIESATGAILALNPHLFPETELQQIFAYGNGRKVLIGGCVPSASPPDLCFEDVYPPNPLCCMVYGVTTAPELTIERDGVEELPPEMRTVPEPSGPHAMFYHDLCFRRVSDSFLKACAEVISACAGGVRVLAKNESSKILGLENEKGTLRLLISNDQHGYSTTRIDVGRPIKQIQVRTGFPGMPPVPDGAHFQIRLPPRGAVVVDVE